MMDRIDATMNKTDLARTAITRFYAATSSDTGKDDLESFLDLLTENVTVKYGWCRTGAPLSGEWSGKESVAHLMAVIEPSAFSDQTLNGPLKLLGDERRVVALGAESYRVKQSGVVEPCNDFAIVMDFCGDKVCRMLHIKDLTHYIDAITQKD